MKQNTLHYVDRELMLFKRFLFASVSIHIILLVFDPSHFFFFSKPLIDEGSINVDLIALNDTFETKQEEDSPPPAPMLPQVTKKFELDTPKKPDDIAFEEKKVNDKEEKALIDQRKSEDELTKVSLDRLIKEANRQKEAENRKTNVLSKSLKERKKSLETGLLHGTLSMGSTEAGYRGVIKAWIQKNYALPEIEDLKNSNIKAIVSFVLNEQGEIMKLTLQKSSSNQLFDQLSMKTVENSAPFPTPPQDVVGSPILLEFEPKITGQ